MINYNNFYVIAAVDETGGFSKNNEIPWHYPADFQWFKKQTQGAVCVMGRVTYEDLLRRAKKKQSDNVNTGNEDHNSNVPPNFELLPGRQCFVISNTMPTQLGSTVGATVLRNIWDIEKHIQEDTPVFLIGGEQIFKQGISFANAVFLTLINKDFICDKFFPTKYLMNHFVDTHVYKLDNEPDLRFTIWKRK